MHLQKLVEVLKKLDEEQIKRLDEYVRSPYFRVPPVCVLLLNRLMPLHPRFMETKMQWQKLGKKDVTLSTIAKQRNAATGLLKAIDGFIAQEQWQLNKLEITRLKLKGYKQLQLEDKFEEGYEEQMAFLENEPEQDIDTFYEKHMLVELSMQGVVARLNRTTSNDIQPVIKTLDEFYALKKICYMCEAINRQQSLGLNYSVQNSDLLLSSLERYCTPKNKYVYLFTNVFKMMNTNDFVESSRHYTFLRDFIFSNIDPSISSSFKDVVDYIQSVCLKWNNKGYSEAGSEYLLWVDWKIKNSLLLQSGKILPVTFRNIVSVPITNGDTTRAKDVIDKLSFFLPKEERDSNVAYANGLYLYAARSYKEAARAFLVSDPKDDVGFYCLVRYWHWRSLYEADPNDVGALYNHLQSFEKYIYRNNRKLKSKATTFVKFLQYAEKLYKYDSVNDYKKGLSLLKQESKFAGKDWLCDKYSEKIGKRPMQSA